MRSLWPAMTQIQLQFANAIQSVQTVATRHAFLLLVYPVRAILAMMGYSVNSVNPSILCTMANACDVLAILNLEVSTVDLSIMLPYVIAHLLMPAEVVTDVPTDISCITECVPSVFAITTLTQTLLTSVILS